MTKLTTDRNELIIKAHNQGKSIEQLSLKHGIGITYVRTILRNAGLIEKRPSIIAKDRNELIFNGYKNGESVKQLAEKYYISLDYIKTILRKGGLTERRPKKAGA